MSADLLTHYWSTNKKEIEKRIALQCDEWKNNELFHRPLTEAMAYSLQAGGKRLRPLMAHMCFDYIIAPFIITQKNESPSTLAEYQSIVADFALCLEMLHTYSLIHDDLPALDDDDLRRGKPTCHKVYGEDVAILAGNALQSEAFYRLARCSASEKIDKNDLCRTIKKVCSAIGPNGMIGGQSRDIESDSNSVADASSASNADANSPADATKDADISDATAEKSTTTKTSFAEGNGEKNLAKNLEALRLTHLQKTGALIDVSFLGPLYLFHSKIPAQSLLAPLQQFAHCLGLAFQIADDILDETSSTEVLGKRVKSDIKNTKKTFTTLLGIKKSQDYLQNIEQQALGAIEKIEQTLKKEILGQSLNESFGKNGSENKEKSSENNNEPHWKKTAKILQELCHFVSRRDH